MELTFSVVKDEAFAPGVTELDVVTALYSRLQQEFPQNTIQAIRVQIEETILA